MKHPSRATIAIPIISIIGMAIAFAMLMSPAGAQESLYTTKDQAIGCRTKEASELLLNTAASGDRLAFAKLVSMSAASGYCRIFEGGEKFHLVERGSIWTNIGAFRRVGEVEIYHISHNFMK